MIILNKEKNSAAVELGRLGGKSNRENHSKEYFKQIAFHMNEVRRQNKIKNLL